MSWELQHEGKMDAKKLFVIVVGVSIFGVVAWYLNHHWLYWEMEHAVFEITQTAPDGTVRTYEAAPGTLWAIPDHNGRLNPGSPPYTFVDRATGQPITLAQGAFQVKQIGPASTSNAGVATQPNWRGR